MTTLRLIVILLLLRLTSQSQTDTIYFSVTGDTVLHSYKFFQPDTTFDIYVLKKHLTDTVKAISSFSLKPYQTLNPYHSLPGDTIKKYHLTYDGIRIDPYTHKDFEISFKCSKPVKIEKCVHGKEYEYIFKTTLKVKIKCKGKVFYSKTFDYMYNQHDGIDLPETMDVIQLLAWKRNNKYFIRCYVKEEQILKCEGEFYSYKNRGYVFFQ